MGEYRCKATVKADNGKYCVFFDRLYKDVYDWMNDTPNWHTYEPTNEFEICISEYHNHHASNTNCKWRIVIENNVRLANQIWYNFKQGVSVATVLKAVKNMEGVKVLYN